MVARSFREKRVTGNSLIIAGCGLAVFAIGIALNVSSEEDQQYHTHSPLGFLYVVARNVAWPFRNQPLLSLVVCLPLVILFVRYLRSKTKNVAGTEFALMFGFWGFMQAAALAYARTSLGNSSRYMDTLCTIPIAGMVGWLVLADDFDFRQWKRRVIPLAWGSLIPLWIVPAEGESDRLSALEPASGIVGGEKCRRFHLSTGDPVYLTNQPPLAIFIFASRIQLMDLLHDPGLERIQPPSCQRPLKTEKDNVADAAFVENGCPPNMAERAAEQIWGSYSTHGAMATGSFVSQPMSARLPELVVRVCASPNDKDIGVRLVEESSGKKIDVPVAAGNQWQTLIVSAPHGPFRVEMTDESPESWVAVGEIKEMGWLSPYVLKLLDFAVVILGAGIGLISYLIYREQKRWKSKAPESGLRQRGLHLSSGKFSRREQKKPKADSNGYFALWLAALFLAVLGAKLGVVQLYGSPLLLWDQWYEATSFFRHWVEGHLTPADFFTSENDHRIFVNWLLNFTVIGLNGRWEPMMQMAVNASLHSLYVLRAGILSMEFFRSKKRLAGMFPVGAFFHVALCGRKRHLGRHAGV